MAAITDSLSFDQACTLPTTWCTALSPPPLSAAGLCLHLCVCVRCKSTKIRCDDFVPGLRKCRRRERFYTLPQVDSCVLLRLRECVRLTVVERESANAAGGTQPRLRLSNPPVRDMISHMTHEESGMCMSMWESVSVFRETRSLFLENGWTPSPASTCLQHLA